MAVYGNIKNESDLRNLQAKAPQGKTAVGITDTGNMFIMGSGSRITQIDKGKAMEYLGLNYEELDLVIRSRGQFTFVEPVQEEPTLDSMVGTIPVESSEDKKEDKPQEEVQNPQPEQPKVDESNDEPLPFKKPYDDMDEDDIVTLTKDEYEELVDKASSYEAIKELIINSKY